MGCCTSASEPSKASPPVEEFNSSTNVKSILQDAAQTAKFRTWLKTKQFKVNDCLLADYLMFYEAVEKRTATYKSGQRCGDSKEKGAELLEKHADDIIQKFTLLFACGPLKELTEKDASGIFDAHAAEALVLIQEFVTKL
jgi:tRNA A22 N-methylase